MALLISETRLEHREILLKNKPPQMLAASPKGTVPVLVLGSGEVIEQSREIMQWALQNNDPDNWLGANNQYLNDAIPLVEQCDGEFKQSLDGYKYADRHPLPGEHYRCHGMSFVAGLQKLLTRQKYLLGDTVSIADIAIMPFVRQFAAVDRPWFERSAGQGVVDWLDGLIDSTLFQRTMIKHPLWQFDQA